MKDQTLYSKCVSLILGTAALAFILGCSGDEKIINQQSSGTFVQEFNPEYVDVLWVIDDRSTLYPVRDHLVSEAKKFFVRLEGMRKSYRMAFITSDMQFAKGSLKPKGAPVILERHIGDSASYVSFFGTVINQVIINLGTGAESKGFEAAETALSSSFKPRSGVPLVLVFISDSEDVSESKSPGIPAVDYYVSNFLKIKEGNPKFIRVYSINYTPTGERCTGSVYNADIDKKKTDGTSAYEGRAFALATNLGGETADICGSFSEKLSLEGLRLKELPNRFTLEKKAKPESISVNIILPSGESTSIPFHYDTDKNEIVFESTPSEGSTIQVSYLPV